MQLVNFTELGYDTPGGRYYTDGSNSAEEYFDKFFNDKFHKALRMNDKVIFYDDDLYGLPLAYFRTIIELTVEIYGPILVKDYINIEKSKISESLKNLFNETINFYLNKPAGYKHPDNLLCVKRYNR